MFVFIPETHHISQHIVVGKVEAVLMCVLGQDTKRVLVVSRRLGSLGGMVGLRQHANNPGLI